MKAPRCAPRLVTGFLRGKTRRLVRPYGHEGQRERRGAATLIGIRPKVAGVDQVLADIHAANMDLISDAGGIYQDQVADVLTDADNFQLPTEQLADLIEKREGLAFAARSSSRSTRP